MVEIDFKKEKVTIVVVGCGGTGSQLLSPLFQLCNNIKDKIQRVILIDGDIYELKNTANQRCLPDDEGYNKAYVMAKRYSYIFPELNICSYEKYLESEKELEEIRMLSSNMIIIGCVDNNPARKILNDYFENSDYFHNLVYVDSGNGTKIRSGQIVVGYKNHGKIILNPVGNVFEKVHTDKDNSEHGGCIARVAEAPQNIATNLYAACNIFNILTNILMYNKIISNIVFFNADDINVYTRG